MGKQQTEALSTKLDQVVKELEAAIEKSASSYEKTALKTYKGTIARVAKDLKEIGQAAA